MGHLRHVKSHQDDERLLTTSPDRITQRTSRSSRYGCTPISLCGGETKQVPTSSTPPTRRGYLCDGTGWHITSREERIPEPNSLSTSLEYVPHNTISKTRPRAPSAGIAHRSASAGPPTTSEHSVGQISHNWPPIGVRDDAAPRIPLRTATKSRLLPSVNKLPGLENVASPFLIHSTDTRCSKLQPTYVIIIKVPRAVFLTATRTILIVLK
jgi:hypothetical protein